MASLRFWAETEVEGAVRPALQSGEPFWAHGFDLTRDHTGTDHHLTNRDLTPNLEPGRAGISRRSGAGRDIWPGAIHQLDRAIVANRAMGTVVLIGPNPSLEF